MPLAKVKKVNSINQNNGHSHIAWNFFKKALFAFDAEEVHEHFVSAVQRIGALSPDLLSLVTGSTQSNLQTTSAQTIDFADKKMQTPVGLAAGFDKNALLLEYLPNLGFSFAEVGSVTLRPQSGNDKPRLFRGENSLFNRMGFNNDGAEVIAERILSIQNKLPQDFVVGINLGINKEVKPEDAATAYQQTYEIMRDCGDYFAINLSSPNTPGLRDLQTLSHIEKIFNSLKKVSNAQKKIFLKLAPELDKETLRDFYTQATKLGIDGFILTNTLKGEREKLVGGWSGAPLTEIARSALEFAKENTSLPLISVGGIMSREEALKRLQRGAVAIQIYTGWIFNGPRFPSRIAAEWRKQQTV